MTWRCPYCQHDSIVSSNFFGFEEKVYPNAKHGLLYIIGGALFCPNEDCHGYSFVVSIRRGQRITYAGTTSDAKLDEVLHSWQLLPESSAKPVPDYIPAPIREDYQEACRIQKLSPKASATLARRCLQGIIRDFWNISKPTLKQEIDAIQDKIDTESFEAIDAVRKIGNIGAHMEKDINVIVEVDPDEAQLLVELIETLFDEWYVARHDRQARMKKVKALAAEKEAERAASGGVQASQP